MGELPGGVAEVPAGAGREWLVNCSERPATLAPGRAQKHFHTASPEGAAVRKCFCVTFSQESNKEVVDCGQLW